MKDHKQDISYYEKMVEKNQGNILGVTAAMHLNKLYKQQQIANAQYAQANDKGRILDAEYEVLTKE